MICSRERFCHSYPLDGAVLTPFWPTAAVRVSLFLTGTSSCFSPQPRLKYYNKTSESKKHKTGVINDQSLAVRICFVLVDFEK